MREEKREEYVQTHREYSGQSAALTARAIGYREVLAGQKIEQKRTQWRSYMEAWKNLGRPLPNFWEQVREYSGPRHRNGSYQNQMRHALALDQYPSRDALVVAVEEYLFSQNVKRMATLPLLAIKRILGKVKKIPPDRFKALIGRA